MPSEFENMKCSRRCINIESLVLSPIYLSEALFMGIILNFLSTRNSAFATRRKKTAGLRSKIYKIEDVQRELFLT